MHVVGRGDHHRVDVLALLKHHAIVFEDFRLGIIAERMGSIVMIDIAQGNDIFTSHFAQIAASLVADTDAGDIQLFAGRLVSRSAQNMARHDVKGGNARGGRGQKTSTMNHGMLPVERR